MSSRVCTVGARDWRLLNHIERQFPEEMMEVRPLQTNYRSERNIILFNNAFFTVATQQEYDGLKEQNGAGAEQACGMPMMMSVSISRTIVTGKDMWISASFPPPTTGNVPWSN